MGQYYPSNQSNVLVGSKTDGGTRTSVDLTASYDVANKTKVIKTAGFTMIDVDVLYTMGATETSNSIEMRVQVSNDNVNFYRMMIETISGGQSVLTAREFTFVGTNAAAATFSIPLDVMYNYMEFTFKETGKVTNFGTVFAECTLSGQ